MFFDPRRYDLAKVGRYKFNKKLSFKFRLNGQVLAEDVVDTTTGEIIAEAGTKLDKESAMKFRTPLFLRMGRRHQQKAESSFQYDG